ncbi:hypothetical protein [Serratia bockelmannii]|uniref:hypothetical protein n=1 Tax=Serratia bockelmannii TaxID=2703793 RepID=UPI0029D3C85A|nr:hypothetical protein [Serratia marcescens]
MKISYLKSSPSLVEVLKNNYEAFIIQKYKFSHCGLFHDEKNIYAVIENLEECNTTLDEIQKLYDYEFRTLGVPGPIFIGEKRDDFIKIDFRNIYEKVSLFGQPFNTSDFHNNISMVIPPKFHPFHVDMKWSDNTFTFTFNKALTQSESDEIILLCESLGFYGYNYNINTDYELPDYKYQKKESNTQGNLTLVAGRYLKNNQPKEILEKYEEDQEFWVENRVNIFSDVSLTRDECLSDSFKKSQNRCFVDASVFPRNNIREYLSLYDTVIIAIPLADRPDNQNFYEIFKINRIELLELVRRGRIKFVAFQNLQRYDSKFLADVLSVDSECVLFSRRLASASLLAIREKTGLFGFSFDSETQYKILKECYNSKIDSLKILAESLSNNIAFLEYGINQKGALGVSQFCGASFATQIYKLRGCDYGIELMSSAMSLEFSLGLGAHHFPFEHTDYSEVNACKILNGIYNGVQQSQHEIREVEIQSLLSNILTINNDMNVLELDDILSKYNRRMIPAILKEYANLTPEELSFKIYSLNKEITKIEKKKESLSILDLSGFAPVIAGAVMEYKGLSGAGYIALLPWVFKVLKITANNSNIFNDQIFSNLESLTLNAPRNTVLVHKIRKDIPK